MARDRNVIARLEPATVSVSDAMAYLGVDYDRLAVLVKHGVVPRTIQISARLHLFLRRELQEVDKRLVRIFDPEAKALIAGRRRSRHSLMSRRRAIRMPAWADKDAIARVYLEAARLTEKTGIVHHVDHVIPLLGRLVSGLHVHNNLQVLTAEENHRKNNRFEPC